MSVKIHPISLRSELLHLLQVRLNKGQKWREAKQLIRYRVRYKQVGGKRKLKFSADSYKVKVYQKGKNGRIKKDSEGNKIFKMEKRIRKVAIVYLISDKKFRELRVDEDIVFKWKKAVNQIRLDRFINKVIYEKVNPVLKYLQQVRRWATSQSLSNGGFPLVPFVSIAKKSFPYQHLIIPTEAELLEGPAKLEEDFQKRFGVGQVWGSLRDVSETIKVWVAVYTQTGWREYRNEMPRFYIRRFTIDQEDVFGNEDVTPHTKENRKAIVDFVLDSQSLQMRDTGGNLIETPLGVVGWAYEN